VNKLSNVTEDPLQIFGRVHTWFHTRWLKHTYPFVGFGKGVSVHHSCDIPKWSASGIQLGEGTYLAQDVWLVVQPESTSQPPQIVIGKNCKLGRRSSIAARNRVVLEDDVLLAPDVLIRDHNHEFSDIGRPIHAQGLTKGGRITIEKNCWLGCYVVLVCDAGELRIGRNSVIAANTVVTRSVPPFSVVAGNPAKIIKTYDQAKGMWMKSQS
jgi:acetyltransferase-like isoleucine patch superfamily enzyme